MLITFFEAVLWMVPIVILENLTNWFLIVRTHLPKEGYCGMCILSDFLQAYLIAGLFEVSFFASCFLIFCLPRFPFSPITIYFSPVLLQRLI